MKNTIITGLFIALAFGSKAQNPGYFNKKNVVELSVNGQYPFFANLRFALNERYMYKEKDGALAPMRDRFDFGFRFAYMRSLKRNFGVGLEFGYDYFSIQRGSKTIDGGMGYNATVYFEKTDLTSMMIMPKMEFSSKGGLLPMGIAHQIGFGVRMVKPADKTTHYALANYDNSGGQYIGNAVELPAEYKYKGAAIRGFTFMYAVNMRSPLTKSLFLNYGIRYTVNFMGKSIYSEYGNYENNNIAMGESELRYYARQRKQVSFIQASIGLSFVF